MNRGSPLLCRSVLVVGRERVVFVSLALARERKRKTPPPRSFPLLFSAAGDSSRRVDVGSVCPLWNRRGKVGTKPKKGVGDDEGEKDAKACEDERLSSLAARPLSLSFFVSKKKKLETKKAREKETPRSTRSLSALSFLPRARCSLTPRATSSGALEDARRSAPGRRGY